MVCLTACGDLKSDEIQGFQNGLYYIIVSPDPEISYVSTFLSRNGSPFELRTHPRRRFAQNFDPDPMGLLPDLKTAQFCNKN